MTSRRAAACRSTTLPRRRRPGTPSGYPAALSCGDPV
ncbi:hypothetical protein Ae150APs1_5504 [Pseudonocardia sp. Ae150A_Ps1]|nr:hypothetical protein Ae150APs1_5504 [Pseudonocardia sp. Ae150A_Ps1]